MLSKMNNIIKLPWKYIRFFINNHAAHVSYTIFVIKNLQKKPKVSKNVSNGEKYVKMER